jgi:DNA gyrase subunit A
MVFSVLGKVFKIPTHKIPITAKGSNGMDIRLLNKYATSNMCCAATESLLTAFSKKSKMHNFIFVCTRNGYIKKIDIADILTAPTSGIIYSKVEEGDYVQSILFGPDKMDLLVLMGNKVLRVPGKQIPYLKRSTRGARISTGTSLIDSMSFINPNCIDLIVVTKSGMVNKLGINTIEPSNRGRAGIKAIKLKKDDQIISAIPALPNSSLVVYEGGRSNTVIKLDDIPYGTTASAGVKLLKNPIRVMVSQNQ